MAACAWKDRCGKACPRQAQGGGDHCIWHNPRVCKSDPYVVDLLRQEFSLRGRDVRGFHLAGLIWPQAELAGVDLSEADLRDAVLPGAQLSGANLSLADLSRAQLSGAHLVGACLRGADLSLTHLGNANLRDADLSECLLNDTILLAADLRGANLSHAQIRGFTWNRLTRFEGLRGFDPPRESSEDASSAETLAFPAPLARTASGDAGISRSSLSALTPPDSAILRSRIFRVPEKRASAEEHPALVAKDSPSPTPRPSPSPLRPTPGPLQYRQKTLLVVLAVATLWAVAGTSLATWMVLTVPEDRPARLEPSPPIVSPFTDERPDESAVYLRQLQQRDQALAALQERAQRLENSLRSEEEERLLLRSEVHRLRSAADQLVAQEEAMRRLRQDLHRVGTQNRRLEETSAILVEGNERLTRENQQLSSQLAQRFEELEESTRFLAERDRAREELDELSSSLAQTRSERDRLRQELERSSAHLERFLTRLEGTRLEALVEDEASRSPLLQISPGRTLSLGGDDVLLSLRVEPSEEPGRVRVHLVVQRSQGRELPDLSLMLYGEDGQALRRLAFSFPSHPHGRPFTSAVTEIDAPSFPSAVRVSAAQGLQDDQWLSSAAP